MFEEREHLAMDDPLSCGHPLDISSPETSGRVEGVGVVNISPARDGDRLEASVGMSRKAGDPIPVVHPPAVFPLEVMTDASPLKRSTGTELWVTRRVVIFVINTEEEGVESGPRRGAEGA